MENTIKNKANAGLSSLVDGFVRTDIGFAGIASDVIIDSVTINHPVSENEHIKVLYREDEDIDDTGYDYTFYDIPNAKGELECRLPFSGKITLCKDYEIIRVDILNCHLALNRAGESVVYNKEDYSDRFTYSIDNSIFKWEFKENWKSYLNIVDLLNNSYDVVAKISLIVRKIDEEDTYSEAFNLPIFFSSECDAQPDHSVNSLKPLSVDVVKIEKKAKLESFCTGRLEDARCYAGSGVLPLSAGHPAFIVAGGSHSTSLIDDRDNSEKIDEFVLDDMSVLKLIDFTTNLSEPKYRLSAQVMKNSNGVSYFISIGGGLGEDKYSNRIEVFEIKADGRLTEVWNQHESLPIACDHMSSIVANYDGVDYLVVAGGYVKSSVATNSICVYTVDSSGLLIKHTCGARLSVPVYGSAIGIITMPDKGVYLLVAGGMDSKNLGSNNVDVFKFSSDGDVLRHIVRTALSVGRGDLAGCVVNDDAGGQYFVVAGGRTVSVTGVTKDSVSKAIDVFGFDDEGSVTHIEGQPQLKESRFDMAFGVMAGSNFVAAGGYVDGANCSNTIDIFSVDTNGILQQKNQEGDGEIVLSESVASSAFGVFPVADDESYFVIAGGVTQSGASDEVEMFAMKDQALQRVFTWNLKNARRYAGFSVANLVSGEQFFIVAGGARESGVDVSHTDDLADIEIFTLKSYDTLTNLCLTTELASGKYRTTAQVMKDHVLDNYYFVLAGGYYLGGYSNEIEVFKVDSHSFTKTEQTVKLPTRDDHISSVVIKDNENKEYLVIAGGYNYDSSMSIYGINDGVLARYGDVMCFPTSIFGSAIGVISGDGETYLIVAGGMRTDGGSGNNDVYIYKISDGSLIFDKTMSIEVGRGDSAYGTIEDAAGKQYFVIAGGRCAKGSDDGTDAIDVFCINNGKVEHVEHSESSVKLNQVRFDIACGVIDNKYFVVAGGRNNKSVFKNIEMFSIGTDGVLEQECIASLKEPVSAAAAGVISDGSQQCFIIAGGSGSNATTDVVEVFKFVGVSEQ